MTPTEKIYSLVDTALTVIRILLTSSWNCHFKDHSNQSLYILGNGPSLNDIIPSKLFGKTCLAVNNFAMTSMFCAIKPPYYVIAAPEYWLDNVDQNYIDMRNNLFAQIKEKLCWDMEIFIPFKSRKYRFKETLNALNQHLKVSYYNDTPAEGLPMFTHFAFKKRLGMPRPHNVLIPSIMIAIWKNFKNIYLFGADHSWLQEIYVSEDNIAYLTQKHFYDSKEAKPDIMKKKGTGTRKLHEILQKFMLTFEAYHQINTYAIRHNISIINKTTNSFIDAFSRHENAEQTK